MGSSTTAASSSDLQGQIQNALKNEPTLSSDTVNVNVTDSSIDLNGTVATGKEKQTAKRIAQSYAGNRKVTDHLTVSGRGNSGVTTPDTNSNNPSGNNPSTGVGSTSPSTTPPSSSSPSSSSPSSTTNPEGNKTNPPSGTQPPKR
jgi:hypothetical protein